MIALCHMLRVVCSSQSASPGPSGWCSGYLQAECLWNKVIKWKISLLSTRICNCCVQETDEFWFHFWFLMTTNNWKRKIIFKNCNCLQFTARTELLFSSLSLVVLVLTGWLNLVTSYSWKAVSSQSRPLALLPLHSVGIKPDISGDSESWMDFLPQSELFVW